MQNHPSSPRPSILTFIVRFLTSRPRLVVSILMGLVVAVALPETPSLLPISRAIVGWNVGAILYIVLALMMMFASTHEKMRQRAQVEDEGSIVVLALVVTAAFMCIAAIVAELAIARSNHSHGMSAHIGLAMATIVSSWFFTQVMFALHYAHDYYIKVIRGGQGGLQFPGDQAPDYGDFLYFSCVIGTSGQTADVSFVSRSMRRTGTVHCTLAFFFNTTILALSINIASGLL